MQVPKPCRASLSLSSYRLLQRHQHSYRRHITKYTYVLLAIDCRSSSSLKRHTDPSLPSPRLSINNFSTDARPGSPNLAVMVLHIIRDLIKRPTRKSTITRGHRTTARGSQLCHEQSSPSIFRPSPVWLYTSDSTSKFDLIHFYSIFHLALQ